MAAHFHRARYETPLNLEIAMGTANVDQEDRTLPDQEGPIWVGKAWVGLVEESEANGSQAERSWSVAGSPKAGFAKYPLRRDGRTNHDRATESKAKNERRTILFIDESGLSQRPHRCAHGLHADSRQCCNTTLTGRACRRWRA